MGCLNVYIKLMRLKCVDNGDISCRESFSLVTSECREEVAMKLCDRKQCDQTTLVRWTRTVVILLAMTNAVGV